jgi:hypothetical protein
VRSVATRLGEQYDGKNGAHHVLEARAANGGVTSGDSTTIGGARSVTVNAARKWVVGDYGFVREEWHQG